MSDENDRGRKPSRAQPRVVIRIHEHKARSQEKANDALLRRETERAAIAKKRQQQIEAAAYFRPGVHFDRERGRLDDFLEAARRLAEVTKLECLALLRSAPGSPLGQELSQAIRDALREHERCWGLLARQPELENHPLLRDGAARRNILDGPGAFRRIKNAVPRSLVRELEPRTDYVNNWIAEKVGEIVRDPERSHLPLPSIEQMRRLLLIEAQKVRLSPAALKVIGVDDPLQPMRDELLAALRVSRQAFHKRLAALGVNDFRRPL